MPSPYKSEDIVQIREDLSNQTDDIKDAVDDVRSFWEQGVRTFKEMGEQGKYSRDHYRRAFMMVFGPVDDPKGRTFDDIIDKYGTYTKYKELRDAGIIEQSGTLLGGMGIATDTETLNDREMELAKIFFEVGYSKGREDERRSAEAIGREQSPENGR